MPLATPNRIADPVALEAIKPPCILRQVGGLMIPFKNTSSTNSYMAGEPIFAFGRVCIVQKTITPGKIGTLIADFIVDAILKSGGSGNIAQDTLIYWDTDLDNLTEIESGDAVTGIGAATTTLPTNGFMLGRAVMVDPDETYAAVAATNRVRVASLPGAPTVYSE